MTAYHEYILRSRYSDNLECYLPKMSSNVFLMGNQNQQVVRKLFTAFLVSHQEYIGRQLCYEIKKKQEKVCNAVRPLCRYNMIHIRSLWYQFLLFPLDKFIWNGLPITVRTTTLFQIVFYNLCEIKKTLGQNNIDGLTVFVCVMCGQTHIATCTKMYFSRLIQISTNTIVPVLC